MLLLALSATLFALAGCRAPAANDRLEPSSASEAGAIFVERAAAVGLHFVHRNGMSGRYYFPEMMGGGGALFDYDNDGDLDVYLVQGGALDDEAADAARDDRLFRNELIGQDGRVGTLRFVEASAEAGIAGLGYGMGVASGDFDNDGFIDLYRTSFGPNQLLRNRGNGSFEDVTAGAGADDRRWSVAATFFDFDRDGWLDLFIANYLDWTLASHKPCFDSTGAQDYCGPSAYRGESDRLLRNRGDGSFEDVSRRAGIEGERRPALGVIAADFNGDRWPDLYVANDGLPNQLWLNQRDGSFRDDALYAGCAVAEDGRAQASMGVAAADFDQDGDDDLVMTHLTGETNTLYRNRGGAVFDDWSSESGLGPPSFELTGFGIGWLDGDGDGNLDLLAVNGAVKTIEVLAQRGDSYPLHQRNQLFHQQGDGRFVEVSAEAGMVFALSEVSRGAAFGDVDNDGDTDVLVINNHGPVRLLLNQRGPRRWLGLRLVGAGERPRDQIGARVGVHRADGSVRWRRLHSDGSYASANDPRILISLTDDEITATRVEWPDGHAERFTELPTERYVVLRQGTGFALPAARPRLADED